MNWHVCGDELPILYDAFFCFEHRCFSKTLGSLWEDLGKAMEAEDEIEIGQVDCSEDDHF